MSKKMPLNKLLILALVSIGTISMFGSRVSAAGEPTTTLPSDGHRLAVAGSGSEFNSPISENRLYVRRNADGSRRNTNVKMHIATLKVIISTLTADGSTCSISLGDFTQDDSLSDGEVLANPDVSTYTITGLLGSESVTYDVYCVFASTTTADDVSFYLTTPHNIDYLANQKSSISGTGYLRDDTPNSTQGIWDKTINFGTPCKMRTDMSSVIHLYDLDIGKQWTEKQGDIRATLKKRSLITGRQNNVDLVGDIDSSGSVGKPGENSNFDIRPSEGFLEAYSYELVLESINDVNAIRIGLPSDQIYSIFSCEPPNTAPSGSLIANCDDDGNVTVFARVSDHEGGLLTVSRGFRGSGNASRDTQLDIALRVSPFNGIRDNANHDLSARVTDPDGESSDISGTYKCKFPPPVISISCSGDTVEVNDAYMPRVSFTHQTGDAEKATVSVVFTMVADNIAGAVFRDVRKTAEVVLPKSTSRSVGVSADSTASNAKFDTDRPVVLTDPGTYKVSYAATWTTESGLSGRVVGSPCPGSVSVVSKPYFRVLGGDIWSTGGAALRAHNKELNLPGHYTPSSLDDPSGKSGSGTQGLLVASGVVSGVASGVMLSMPLDIKPLTLANFAPPASTDVSSVRAKSTYGGGFGVLLGGLPVADAAAIVWSPAGSTPAANTSAVYTYTPASGTVNYSNTSVPSGARMTVYVYGDLVIDGDVRYSNSGNFVNLSQIPHIKFVVHKNGASGGNIYIKKSVKQIDAELYAERELDTCHEPDNKYPACSSTLLINGSIMAAKVSLNRLNGTIRSSTVDDGKMGSCMAAAPLENGYCNYANTAEIIQYVPELYLSTPAESPPIPLGNQYDSITSLPPLF